MDSHYTNTYYKIVHIDAARKYISPANIMKLLDVMEEAGYNQLELYLSDNQGLRFALEDMKMSVSKDKENASDKGNSSECGRTVYNLGAAVGDGYSTENMRPDGSGKYITQPEMDEIIYYAREKGIEIVPCINSPGHMGAILEHFPKFRYKDSKSSIDLENEEAVEFAQAIVEKYAAYFESRGIKYFNIGADEYANDMEEMGFEGLYKSGKYTGFVQYLNRAAKVVLDHHMIPRVFNDGMYYNDDIDCGGMSREMDRSIQVCYWTSGWNGYHVASPATIASMGHDLINTNGDYYWVLGREDWQCSGEMAAAFEDDLFQGKAGKQDSFKPSGKMFCIWCDDGAADGMDEGDSIIKKTEKVIKNF